MYVSYQRGYENFTHLPDESIDALFQRFMVVVNNMRANVALMLFSNLKSVEVDRGMTAKIEGPTNSHSLTLIGGSKGKTNANPSTRMFSLSSLMSMPDEEFDALGEDELALLTRRFERLHENRVNMRKNTRTCFHCGKPGHFVVNCPEKAENKDSYKHKSRRRVLEVVFILLETLSPSRRIFIVSHSLPPLWFALSILHFVVSERDIEANPDKISAIMDMGPIKNLKGVQRVMGSLAGLSLFIARLGERSLPLYKLMKKSDHFTWMPEAQEALDSFKNILKSPPILTAPTIEEPMLLYISARTQVVSAAFVVEREEPGRSQKVQRLVYFVSEVLSDSKTHYSKM
jgi:hypothetical protein